MGRIDASRRAVAVAAALALGGCAGAPARKPAPQLTPEQHAALRAAEKQYRAEDPEFAAARDGLSADPATAFWLTRMLEYDVMRALEQRRSTDQAFLASVSGDTPVPPRALEHLRALGAAAVPALQEDLLFHEYADRRQLGIELLVAIGPAVLPALQPALRDPEWRRRQALLEVAGALEPSPEATAFLQAGAADEHFAVRAAAVSALVRRGDAELGQRTLRSDPDPFVRRAAAVELGAHNDRASAAALVAYLAECVARGDARGAEAANQSLREISGYRHSGDPSFWQAWLASWSGKEQG
jgi:hypothetical protein